MTVAHRRGLLKGLLIKTFWLRMFGEGLLRHVHSWSMVSIWRFTPRWLLSMAGMETHDVFIISQGLLSPSGNTEHPIFMNNVDECFIFSGDDRYCNICNEALIPFMHCSNHCILTNSIHSKLLYKAINKLRKLFFFNWTNGSTLYECKIYITFTIHAN